MSGIDGVSTTAYGALDQLIANTRTIRLRIDTLTQQVSSGYVSQTYAGLGEGAATALNLNPHISAIQTWQNNINQTSTRMQVTQNAMNQLESIASTFYANTNNLNKVNSTEVDSTAAGAQQALVQVANLLDTQDGNTYVFGGQDSSNPPVPDPSNILSSGFYTQINTAVSALSTNGAAATIASTLATATSNATGTSPFSAYMSQPASALSAPVVQVGLNDTVQYGLLASANSSATSTGTATTGSYMRDLMRGLATIASMSSSQVNDPAFATLVQDTRTSLNGAVTAMNTDIGVLGETQSNLSAIKTQLGDSSTALTTQVSSVQDVDMAQTLSALTQTNTQLQASYQVLATENGLSLAKFLPAA